MDSISGSNAKSNADSKLIELAPYRAARTLQQRVPRPYLLHYANSVVVVGQRQQGITARHVNRLPGSM